MTSHPIQRPTRPLAPTGRELKPGERFFGVLLDEAGKFTRKDFAGDAWAGPPPGAVGFWMGRVPAAEDNRRPAVNDEVLFDCFEHLEGEADPGRRNFRYVVALLLMRRKRLRFEDAARKDGREVLQLRDVKSGARYEVADPRLGEAEMAEVQREVFKLLGWE